MVVVICGVAGVGKTTVGNLLAQKLGWPFYEGDDFHPQTNIDKMRSGKPLTEEDRQPWLQKLWQLIERCLANNENAVLACSALKRKYRDQLRVGQEVKFVFLRATRQRIAEQLQKRRGHFMSAALLDSQFADLEEPDPSENAITIEVRADPQQLVDEITARLRRR